MTTNSKKTDIGYIKITFRVVAILLGLLQAWANINVLNTDVVSYLDIGDAYLRGDWKLAINAVWSPLYSWLLALVMFILKPSPYWEGTCICFLNFVIYLLTIICFEFLLNELIYYHRETSSKLSKKNIIIFPEWAFYSLGYVLFIFCSLELIGLFSLSPDMCVSAFVYLISGIILRIRAGATGWFIFFLFGFTLSIGYLAKAPMFLLAFVFLIISVFSIGNLKIALPRILVSLICFFLIAGPFIFLLSKSKGYLTFNENGKLNYAYHVNNLPENWLDGIPAFGLPLNPMEKIFDNPRIRGYGTIFKEVTYPPLYDPSYWDEGLKLHFDLKEQIRAFLINIKEYGYLFFHLQAELVFACLILFCFSSRKWLCLKDLLESWIIIIPALSGMIMYSLVHVENRYIGAFILLIWMSIFLAIRLPNSKDSMRLLSYTAVVILTMVFIRVSHLTMQNISKITQDLAKGKEANTNWLIANGLNKIGIKAGDKVIALSANLYWARLAKLKIVGEVDGDLWNICINSKVQPQIIAAFASIGTKAIITDDTDSVRKFPFGSPWQRIGKTNYYVYLLP